MADTIRQVAYKNFIFGIFTVRVTGPLEKIQLFGIAKRYPILNDPEILKWPYVEIDVMIP